MRVKGGPAAESIPGNTSLGGNGTVSRYTATSAAAAALGRHTAHTAQVKVQPVSVVVRYEGKIAL